MILISKEEAKALRKVYGELHLVRTCKQKSKRGRYYMEERPEALKVLEKIRGSKGNRVRLVWGKFTTVMSDKSLLEERGIITYKQKKGEEEQMVGITPL